MKPTGITLMIIGGLAILWGGLALMLAFNGFTADTSWLGPGLGGYGVSATVDEEGQFVPITTEQEEQAAADYQVLYDANIKLHKTRGGLVLGGGVVVLAVGILVATVGRRKSSK